MHRGNDIAEIDVSLQANVLTIAINRPHKKNALSGVMYERMAELIEAAGQSCEVRVIVLTGTPECFSSGNDVSDFADAIGGSEQADVPPAIRFLRALIHCELPVVAAVNGPAIGVGTTLLLHCDFVVAGSDARFQTPFVSLGVCPEAASSYTMPLRMGYTRAARMLLLGEWLNAEEALACELVSALYPAAEYLDEARALAARLARQSSAATRATKKLLRAPLLGAIEAAMEIENVEFEACMRSPEFAEAITAFMHHGASDPASS